MDELPAAKQALRGRMLAERLAIGAKDHAEKSASVCAAIESLPEYGDAACILFYMPIRGEVDIKPLISKALAEGRTCALPKCAAGRRLRLFFIKDIMRDTAPGTWGIPEPVEGRARECTGGPFSVIMVPGVAFGRNGARLGYGGGYYDGLLSAQGKASLKIAPAFAMQVLDDLPMGPLDGLVDIVATEEGIIDCRKAGGVKHG
jgi:5-formyltetrahydrofolate cyclo-ligase